MPQRVQTIISTFDKALQSEASKYCQLSIQISQDGFSFCIFDVNNNKYVGIEAYEFQNVSSVSVFNTIMTELIQKSDWLRTEFNKTNIIVDTPKSTLIPVTLFDHNQVASYLKLSYSPDLGDVIGNDNIRQLDAQNIYSIPDIIVKTLRQHFPKASIHHCASSLIESLLVRYKNLDTSPIVFANVRKSWLDIIVLNKGKLQFFNSFRYKEKEDFVYFLIFVFEQLSLNPENIEVILLGEVPKESQLFDLTFQYVRNVGFMDRSNSNYYSYVFDNIPGHYYFNLLNLQRCEL